MIWITLKIMTMTVAMAMTLIMVMMKYDDDNHKYKVLRKGQNYYDNKNADNTKWFSFRREGPDLRHTCKITLREASLITAIIHQHHYHYYKNHLCRPCVE